MEEQFATYEIALELKELGFDEECIASYYTNIKENNTAKYDVRKKLNASFDYNAFTDEDDSGYIRNSDKEYYISAPLWQQVIDWFREKQNIYINIEPITFDDEPTYIYEIINLKNGMLLNDINSSFIDPNEAREQAILKALELCQKEK